MRTFLGFPIAAASAGNVPFGQMQPQKRPMYARLFDRLNPGSDGMSDADKQAAIRQGLLGLAAGMASTGGQGTAAAIGNGLQSGLLAMNTARTDHLDRQAREQYMQGQLHDPAALREFNELTRIAGDENEPEHRRSAARVRLGLDGRASSAGFSQVKFRSADGRERIGVLNGRTGRIDTPDGLSFDPREVQISPDQGMGGGMPDMGALGGMPDPGAMATPAFGGGDMGGNPFSGLLASVPGLRVTSQHRTPERNAEVGGVPNSYHLTGEAIDIGRPSPEQQQGIRQWAQANGYRIKNDYADGHWHLEPARGSQPAQPQASLWASRRPEDDEAAKERARIQANIDTADAQASANIPPGYRRTADGNLEPIPGSKPWQEQQDSERQARLAQERQQRLGSVVVQDMDRALSILDSQPSLGGGTAGALTRVAKSRIPGTAEYAMRGHIESAKDTISLENLQGLKEASGAGLGNVSEKQTTLLSHAYGSIDLSADDQTLRDQLARTRNIYLDIIFGHGRGPERLPLSYQDRWVPEDDGWVDDRGRPLSTFGAADQRQAPSTAPQGGPQPGAIEGGYRFRGGDPGDPNNWERI